MDYVVLVRKAMVLLSFVGSVTQAATCSNPSNPNSAYIVNNDGTVTHKPTGLIWKRCSEGEDSFCDGTPSKFNWSQALKFARESSFAGFTDWRLPNLKELRSLVEECRTQPAINDDIFPIFDSIYWTSSPEWTNWTSDYAWIVSFHTGYTSISSKDSENTVRLVRGGQSFAPTAPSCTLTSSPAIVTTGSSTTLTAQCNPAAINYIWTGGTCAGTTSSTCTVMPSSTTNYTVQGVNSGGKSSVASATVSVSTGSAVGLYDGIYLWSDGNYLSLHQDASKVIATIYFNDNGAFTFSATTGGTLSIPQLDLFDLLAGTVTGTTAKISGTIFHRACNVSYDFVFGANATIAATRTSISNTAMANAAGISCSAIVANESPTRTMQRIAFGAPVSPPVAASGVYDGIYAWTDGNYLSVHQDSMAMIATNYFNDNTSISFMATSGGALLVPQLDLFDLLSGSLTGSTARIIGTRFHRACNVSYDFTFGENATLTATRTGVSNTPIADAAGISCSALLESESATLTIPKIFFGR